MFPSHPKTLPWGLRLLVLALMAFQLAACNVFETKDEIANNARVVVTGTAQAPLLLITSTKFERWQDEEGATHVNLVASDTAQISLATAFDQVYPVKPDKGFLVRLVNPETEPAVVSLQVYFDGELNYDQSDVSLSDASIEFSYIFTNFNQIR